MFKPFLKKKKISFSPLSCLCVHKVKPLKVKIVSPNEILTAGIKSPLRCEAWGSAPPGLYKMKTIDFIAVYNKWQ